MGYHGLLAERGNAQSLAEKLVVALESPELGASLRQRAVQHFSWRAAGETIVAAYTKLIGAVDKSDMQKSDAQSVRASVTK